MTSDTKPAGRPAMPLFSSGPCRKYPAYSAASLGGAFLGRSHRAKEGKARLKRAIDETKSILELPADFHVAVVPGSDTGAFEMAMWSLLGERKVDVLAWESFGKVWVVDVVKELKADARVIEADFGLLPDLSSVDFSRDVVFTANGTTSGVRIPNYDWIPIDRQGLTLVDATSAVFAQPVDWAKVDVLTFSWQKVLGGEAAHGMLVLSPRAVSRLESHRPPWPLPKLFRMTKGGKLDHALFEGETINTPSMLCVEDYILSLEWARSVGGLRALIARADANARVLFDWIAATPWVENLARDPATWSNTSVCMRIADPAVLKLPPDRQAAIAKSIADLLDRENVAKDIGSYRDAPAGLRIWTGATIEKSDLEALTPWLDWAYGQATSALKNAA